MPTEMEIIQHAQKYVDQLSRGFNPLTGEQVAQTDVVREERISKCLAYVSGILGKVIRGETIGKRGKAPFTLTPEQISRFPFSDTPLSATALAREIDRLRSNDEMKPFRYSSITGFLMQEGLLERVESEPGKTKVQPTQKGKEMGIRYEERISTSGGQYMATLYDRNMQEYLLAHMGEMIELNNMQDKRS